MISGKVSLSILPLLALLAAAPTHASSCPEVDAVLAQLPEKVPQTFPSITSCENDFQKALAEEVAASIQQAMTSRDATQLAALADLLAQILQRHKEPTNGPRPVAFFGFASELASHLGRQVPAGATPEDQLSALDDLIAELRQEPPVPLGWQRMFPFVLGALALIVIALSALFLHGQLIPAEHRREKPGRGKPGPPPQVTRSVTRPQEGSGTRAMPGAPALLGDRQEPRAHRERDVTPGRTVSPAIVRDGAVEKAAPGAEGTSLRQELQRLSERVVYVEQVVALLPYDVASMGTGSSPSPDLGAKVSALETDVQALDRRLGAIEQHPPAPTNPGIAAATLQRRIEAVELSLYRLQEPRPVRPNGPAADASADLDLELAVLRATWERTLKELPFLDSLGDDAGKSLREELLRELPRAIEADEELRSACASVLAPVRELENLIRKVAVAQKLVAGTLPPLEQPERQLQRIRESATLLTMLHSSASFAERLNFRLEQWAGERFLTFADLFLQKRQQALLQGGLPSPALEEGCRIVLNVLAAADLVPIEIELGRTLFDSSQHVGRSTASQPGLRDGVIASVVRNGFRQRGGRVVRLPEVVVNRL